MDRRLIVGVDLDGVIGDQIAGVVPRIKDRLGIDLAYEDVTEFRLPLGSSDLAIEIERAQREPSYLSEMPAHAGAVVAVAELRRRYIVILITARPRSSRAVTYEWLRSQGFEFDGIINAEESKKSLYGADVLIDDYTGNIADFLEHTDGLALLVDRPWNRRDRARLRPWIDQGRAVVIAALPDAKDEILAFERLLDRAGREHQPANDKP